MKRIIVLSILFLVFSTTHAAQADVWTIDKDHTAVTFKVKHIHSKVFGLFSEYDGDVVFNPGDLENSRFDLSVRVKSVNTFHPKRDNHLRSKDFFHADKFDTMRFTSETITLQSENTYRVKGKMRIKDVTKDIETVVHFSPPVPSPFDKKKQVAGFDTTFSINRLDYNVGNGKFYNMGVVGKTVDIHISLEGIGSK
ncbi:MAG: polyisoprenoid-binding protein [Desulfobacteraceae bacterium]|nr:MAG: polyisoprenoid-binding protein [Desulfobacteraceae bacterium]